MANDSKKFCFIDKARPCDLTCKAAFEVDDPQDPVDCHFIWLAYHFGEGLFSLRQSIEEGRKPPMKKNPPPGPSSHPN